MVKKITFILSIPTIVSMLVIIICDRYGLSAIGTVSTVLLSALFSWLMAILTFIITYGSKDW